MKNVVKLSLLSAAIATGSMAIAEEQKFVTIGTGGQTGVYYVVGQSICQLVNRSISEHGIKCNAPSTGGSVANINAIGAGEQDMGVAQSDWQYHAYNGTAPDKIAENKEIRAVFSVHAEPLTVVARADSGVTHMNEIKGKRVNIGNPGSGTRGTTEVAMEALGLSAGDLALSSELKAAEMAAALCDNNLDVITYVVGHPSGAIKEAGASCESVVVPVTGEGIDKLVADNPYYAKATIPGGMYNGTDADVETFGVYATFVSSTNTDEETIYQVVKAVFDNFERFKKLHPAFEGLKEEDMIKNALSAPLHDGAIKYYKEKGWM
ncbi:TAXI family TRAP transporter solute-binding subunit [Ostreibacterium oceani]|uniref:TAXI family TRAP transporter solute-binding subunit n=1 Tax=Ostreibacterium oceani TaxID=2654998 RepID=A0A6N7ETA8_9GAMM|nr:TAXI family TRAP transporter solute-binding subunit [Ostreibacterium oceani]MPV85672.1 TAXI family TRAP transporter solute-binding subunit [Ostreibacterium oceani]